MQQEIKMKKLPENTVKVSIETDEIFQNCEILATTKTKQIHILHKNISYDNAINLLVRYNKIYTKEN